MMLLLLALGCSGGASQTAVDLTPHAIEDAMCGVCGMVVSEQPSPRAQVVFRDGTHQHLCSLDEFRATAQSPSPHGKPLALYVEALPESFQISANNTAALSWIPAEEAFFVYGAKRPLVMGHAGLSFSNEAVALKAAKSLDTSVLRWADLRDTPFHTIPKK